MTSSPDPPAPRSPPRRRKAPAGTACTRTSPGRRMGARAPLAPRAPPRPPRTQVRRARLPPCLVPPLPPPLPHNTSSPGEARPPACLPGSPPSSPTASTMGGNACLLAPRPAGPGRGGSAGGPVHPAAGGQGGPMRDLCSGRPRVARLSAPPLCPRLALVHCACMPGMPVPHTRAAQD